MSNVKTAYGSNNQTFNCSLASLANSAARQSDAISNAVNDYIDILVQLKVKSGASGTSAAGFVCIYAVGSADGGTSYGESAGASDAGITLTVPSNAKVIGSMNIVANGVSYISNPMSVAAAFGGVLPDHVVIIVENQSGHALDTTEGNHAKFYQGVYATVA